MNLRLILTLSIIGKSLIFIFMFYLIFHEYRMTDNLIIMPTGKHKILTILLDLFILSLFPSFLLAIKDLKSNALDFSTAPLTNDEVLDFEISKSTKNEKIKSLKKFNPLHFWTLITSVFHVGISSYVLFTALKNNKLTYLTSDLFEFSLLIILLGLLSSGLLSLLYLYQIKKIEN